MMVMCVAIQAFVVSILLSFLDRRQKRKPLKATTFEAAGLLTTVLLIMLAGNLVQVGLWAWMFLARGEFELYGTAFYHSLVNFSTLGYGDIVMSERSRLLGGLEAANGILMLGLTTSVLFIVLQTIIQKASDQRPGKPT
jgi:hypothetical protein